MALNMQPVYVLASGGSRAMEQLDTITNNIANANTAGFKRVLMEEMSQKIPQNGGDSANLFVFARFKDSPVILEQGSLRFTQNGFDFAIEGEGFFVVENGAGEELLTRNGHFFLNAEGYLVDDGGNYVLDEDSKRISLDGDKEISVGSDGRIFQNGVYITKLKTLNYESVYAAGEGYYRPRGAAKESNGRILQGYLESSNVNVVKEMSDMIVAQRRFEIYGNLIRSLDALEQKSNEIGKA